MVARLHLDLRYTYATLILCQGIHPKIVSERLGHASVMITLATYSHVVPGLQAVAARRFEEGLLPKSPEKRCEQIVSKSGGDERIRTAE